MPPFDYGAGHIQPDLAMEPGLTYDLSIFYYLNLLCAYSQSKKQTEVLYGNSFICPKSYNVVDFNYPTITVLDLGKDIVNVSRSVTNVGPPSTYNVTAKAPDGVSVLVEPSSLTFKEVGENKPFKVIGELLWSDGKHNVRSPIVVRLL